MRQLILTAVLALTATFSNAGFNLKGSISDASGVPIIGAIVRINNTFLVAKTNLEGKYQIKNINSGTYTLKVVMIGYTDLIEEIDITEDTELNLVMEENIFVADELIVNATRSDSDEPITQETISKEAIEKRNLGQDLPILLNFSPSVVTTSDAGGGVGYTGLRIRGSDATRINVTVNGIPINDSESQGTFWVNMPDFASSTNSIQIQRGVGSSTNGSGAFGATINLQTTSVDSMPY